MADQQEAALDVPQATRRRIILGLVLANFLVAAEVTIVGTALPTVIARLDGIDRYAWVYSTYLLATTVTLPLYGRLADTIGSKPVLFGGVGAFILGTLLCGFAPNIEVFIAARTLLAAAVHHVTDGVEREQLASENDGFHVEL